MARDSDSMTLTDLATIGAVALGVYFLVQALQKNKNQQFPLDPDFGVTNPGSWDS